MTSENKYASRAANRLHPGLAQIPVAISARHVHLTQGSIDRLFGPGYSLRVHSSLMQPGQYAAEETVTLVGPRGHLSHVRIVGPPRLEDQVELSRTDEIMLGIDAPVRESGDLADTPGIAIEGPAGCVTLACGVICALRHIHMTPADADVLGLKDQDSVAVAVVTNHRRVVFGDVVVRVSPEYRLELHLDADEGNAAGLHSGEDVLLTDLDLGANAALPSVHAAPQSLAGDEHPHRRHTHDRLLRDQQDDHHHEGYRDDPIDDRTPE
jgi:acetate kinase